MEESYRVSRRRRSFDRREEEPLHTQADPKDIGIAFGNFAEDFPLLYGLDAKAISDSAGVTWLVPTWRDALRG